MANVNREYCRYWIDTNTQMPSHSTTTLWAALSTSGTIAQYFLHIREAIPLLSIESDILLCYEIFLAQCYRPSQDSTKQPGFIKMRQHIWPPCGPDYSTMDFFLWGDSKSRLQECKNKQDSRLCHGKKFTSAIQNLW